MDAKIVGGQIRKNRQKLKLTQKELAQRLFVSNKTVSRWELGKGLPDIDELPQLAALFGISLDELVGNDDSRAPGRKGRGRRALAISVAAAFGAALVVSTLMIVLSATGVIGRQGPFVFEAEDAVIKGYYRIERTSAASGGACAAWLHERGQTLTFDLVSAKEREATLGVMFNHPMPLVFEDKMLLSVNGENVTVGNVNGTGYNGTDEEFFYSFVKPAETKVRLVRGRNTVVITVVDGASLNIDHISLDNEARVAWRTGSYTFEAETDADVSGIYSIEETARASGGKCLGWLEERGQTLTFTFDADVAAEATLGIFITRPSDVFFEDKYRLAVNGAAVSVGAVKGIGNYDGSHASVYYSFFNPVTVDVALKKGENTIVFTVEQGANFDCINLKTTAKLSRKT